MRAHIRYSFFVKGFTLIELMLAMVIGTFLMAGVFTVYINGRAAQDNTEKQLTLVDDGRFAIEAISEDIILSGLWGQTANLGFISGHQSIRTQSIIPKTVAPDPLPTITDLESPDCGVYWYLEFDESLNASNGTNIFSGECIDDADYLAGTDLLVTKFAAPSPTVAVASLADNVVYVYSNKFRGEVFIGKTVPTNLDAAELGADQQATIHRLKTRVYYIRKDSGATVGYPSLHRLDLDVGPKISDTLLLPGVENFQVQFGIDTTNDGSADMYVDADSTVTNLLTRIKTVQFWVLMRSRDIELPDGTVQTIVMAGQSRNYNDGYRRIVMSAVVIPRNRQNFNVRTGG